MSTEQKQARAWCFTINNYTEEERAFWVACEVKYKIVGEEVGEGGTKHLQGYVIWKRNYRLAQLKKLMPRAHWEVAKCSDAMNYCMKEKIIIQEDNRIAGKRRDIDEAYEAAELRVPEMEFIKRRPGFQSLKLFEHVRGKYQEDRLFKPRVIWLWGPTGVGKTRLPFIFHSSVAKIDRFDYWFGYDNQETVLLDELRPHKVKWADLLTILDRYPYTVKTFYGHKKLNSPVMYITAPLPPAEMYMDCVGEDLKQLERRIDFVIGLEKPLEVEQSAPALRRTDRAGDQVFPEGSPEWEAQLGQLGPEVG